MIIRQASLHDSGVIQRLLTQLGYPPPDVASVVNKIENYSMGDYQLLVGDIEGEIVGFISLHWFDIFHSEGKIGRVTSLCVSDHVRAQGIGLQLMNAGEKFLRSRGCSKLEVTCNFKRTSTHEFYRKIGYTEDSKRFIKTLSLENQKE